MPRPPAGEQQLRDHAHRFAKAEGVIVALLAQAAAGNREAATRRVLEELNALRLLNHAAPVIRAYLHEHPDGRPDAVRDLGRALAKRLDVGTRIATDSARQAIARVTADNLDDVAAGAVIAAVDRRGTRWTLSRWAEMHCATTGRTATSRGIADRVGDGNTVTVHTGKCGWCASHAGVAVVGQDPLPPYHPHCTCVASR